jgi:hypothetical protein
VKRLEKDYRVAKLFNTDLMHTQQYLFNRLKIEPTSKVKVEYGSTDLWTIAKKNMTTFSRHHLRYCILKSQHHPSTSKDGIRHGSRIAVFNRPLIQRQSIARSSSLYFSNILSRSRLMPSGGFQLTLSCLKLPIYRMTFCPWIL